MNEVYFASDHVLTYGDFSDFLPHKHMAQHIVVGMNGKINCLVENERISCEGIFIDGMKMHTIINDGTEMLVLMIEDSTNISEEIKKKYLCGKAYYLLSFDVIANIRSIWKENMSDCSDLDIVMVNYPKTFELILQACKIERRKLRNKDYRIKKVIQSLRNRNSIEKDIMEELAGEVFLSRSRLSHLFKEETGIALKNYLLLMKVWKTYGYILEGMNLSDACIQAGFSSLSHFVATNKKWFGMSIKQEQKQFSRFIEIKELEGDKMRLR